MVTITPKLGSSSMLFQFIGFVDRSFTPVDYLSKMSQDGCYYFLLRRNRYKRRKRKYKMSPQKPKIFTSVNLGTWIFQIQMASLFFQKRLKRILVLDANLEIQVLSSIYWFFQVWKKSQIVKNQVSSRVKTLISYVMR